MKRWISIAFDFAIITPLFITFIPNARPWHVCIPMALVIVALVVAIIVEAIREFWD